VISDVKKSKADSREKRLQKRIKELSTLYEVSKILTSALDLDEALNLIVETTAKMMRVKACGLRLFDKASGEMVLRAVYGLSQDYINKGRVFAWKGVYKGVILNGRVAVVRDVASDPRFEYTEEAIKEGIKSMLSVGLMLRGETIGALSVYTDRHCTFTSDQIRIFKGIANEAAIVVERAKLYKESMESQRIEQELTTAAKIQANLMPRENPKVHGYEVAAKTLPSHMIGGDFYDFIPFDELHLGIVIGDVSGKGIPGAILMASARASLRAYLEDPHTVKEVIAKLNRVLHRDTQSDQFVSLFYGMLDAREGTLTYTNAGHNTPILLREHKQIFLKEGGSLLGILEEASYGEGKVQLLPGDVVIFYTDGITEAERGDESFGEERLTELVRTGIRESPGELLERVLGEVARFSGSPPQSDDRTIIVLRRVDRHGNRSYSRPYH
jgi:sigma-B regulation protein RsbU (phosphoserine phosphatase)